MSNCFNWFPKDQTRKERISHISRTISACLFLLLRRDSLFLAHDPSSQRLLCRLQKPVQVETSKSQELKAIQMIQGPSGGDYGFESGWVPVSRAGVGVYGSAGDHVVEMDTEVYSSMSWNG